MAVERVGNRPPGEQIVQLQARATQQGIATAQVKAASDTKTVGSIIPPDLSVDIDNIRQRLDDANIP